LPDAIIASTAIIYDLILLTKNISDFNKITELNILDPNTIK
jgi:predicted nucleic acid-binding protein